MLSYRTSGFAGHAVQYSPFYDNKIACAGAANFGLVGNGRLQVLDIAPSGQIVAEATFDTQDGLFGVAWSELHQNHLATAAGDGSVKVFDMTRPQFPLLSMTEHTREVFGVNWNMVQKDLFCSSSWDGSVKVWNAQSDRSLATLTAPVVSTSRTESVLAVKSRANAQAQTHSPSADLQCVYNAKFSPHDGNLIVSAHADSAVRMWDVRDASRPVHIIANAHSGAECLCVDWNKYRPFTVASGGVDRAIKVWDIRRSMGSTGVQGTSASPVNELLGHEYTVRSVSWSPHSAYDLLSTSYDTTVRVWSDSSENQAHNPRLNHSRGLKAVFNTHKEFVIGCDWSLWGEPGWVVTTGWDELVLVWRATS